MDFPEGAVVFYNSRWDIFMELLRGRDMISKYQVTGAAHFREPGGANLLVFFITLEPRAE